MPTTLTSLLSNFITGAAAIPAILIFGYFISADATPQRLLTDLKSVFVFLNTYSSAAWLITGVVSIVCVILGIVIDFIGNAIVDEHLFNFEREIIIAKDEKDTIINSAPDGASLKFGTLVQSYFYTHAPEHLLQYHAEQWIYSALCRNAAIVALLYLLAGDFVFIKLHHWRWAILWGLFWAVITLLLSWVLKFGISYYYRVETVFVIGWLREKNLSKVSANMSPGKPGFDTPELEKSERHRTEIRPSPQHVGGDGDDFGFRIRCRF